MGTTNEIDGGAHHDASAIRCLSANLFFWGIGGITLLFDLWSKQWAFSALKPHEIRPVIAGAIGFRRSLNDGAVFGALPGHPIFFIIASVVALCVVVYMFSQSTRPQRALHAALALILAGALGNLYDRAFVIADVVRYENPSGREVSAIGRNLNEPDDSEIRLTAWPEGSQVTVFQRSEVVAVRQGVVRDFIKFAWKFPAWVPRVGGRDVWPWVFNIADAALVCGVGILVCHVLFDRKKRPKDTAPA